MRKIGFFYAFLLFFWPFFCFSLFISFCHYRMWEVLDMKQFKERLILSEMLPTVPHFRILRLPKFQGSAANSFQYLIHPSGVQDPLV